MTSSIAMINKCHRHETRKGVPTPAIMIDGECNDWCAKNPADCDSLKFAFCKQFPESSLCDCINASSRPEFIQMMERLPTAAHTVPLPCFLQSRCGYVDLYNMLIPESARKMHQYCPDTLIDMSQTVNCSGAYCYNVSAKQSAEVKEKPRDAPVQAPAPAPKSGLTTNQLRILILFIAFFIIVLIIAYVYFSSEVATSG